MRRRLKQPVFMMMVPLLVAMILQAGPLATNFTGQDYLGPQASVLRPGFRDLSGLSQAPYYEIRAAVDLEKGRVQGQLKVRYANASPSALSDVVFRLLPNADTIYGGGSLTVERVTRSNMEVPFELAQDQTMMSVSLDPAVAPGNVAVIRIDFTTQVPAGTRQGYGILNRARDVLTLSGWYPILAVYQNGWSSPPVPSTGDAMWAETSFYRVKVTIPGTSSADVDVLSTGVVNGVQNSDTASVWTMTSGPAREFTLAISADFGHRNVQVDGVDLRFHFLPASQPRTSPDTALTMATDALEAFVEHFGPYPFTELDVVEVPISIGGYEFSGIVFVDDRLRTRGSPVDYRYLVAHELAHQWWYGLVGNNSTDEPWLDESLASYSASIYLEDAVGSQAARGLINYWKRTYGSRAAGEPPVNSSAREFSSWLSYRQPVYYHGALFLDALREKIGDEAFFGLLQRYAETFRYQQVTTGDFIGMAQNVSDEDLSPLIDSWFDVSNQLNGN
jgi:hypothetical protein